MKTTEAQIDWDAASASLDQHGYADLGKIMEPDEAADLAASYDDDKLFRSHVIMRRHGFGEGEYKYFGYPLPDPIARLRTDLYPGLAQIANAWADQMGIDHRYPETHRDMLARCREAGQVRPTPLLLSYGEGDYNCLHQDLYGDILFPIQVVILLSQSAAFAGGEFVLTTQRPRMQSRAEVVPLLQGHAVAFAVNERPVKGARGYYRVKQRHGVSRIRRGSRQTLGIIFHDAK